jgi:phage terminase large subunit GpA-like protein
VQHDRVEIIVRAWAPGEESWLVERIIIHGTPQEPTTWQQVDDALARTWEREDGAQLKINTLCIDSGYWTDAVYAYVKPRLSRRVYATKGYSTPGRPLVARRPTMNNKARVKLFMIGADTGLDVLYGRLKSALSGPGAYHFHADADADYFEQLTAKTPQREWRNGRWTRRYVLPRGKRDEVQDCEVLALVALELSSIGRRKLNDMPRTVAVVADSVDPDREPEPAEPDTKGRKPKPFKRPRQKPWMFRT